MRRTLIMIALTLITIGAYAATYATITEKVLIDDTPVVAPRVFELSLRSLDRQALYSNGHNQARLLSRKYQTTVQEEYMYIENGRDYWIYEAVFTSGVILHVIWIFGELNDY